MELTLKRCELSELDRLGTIARETFIASFAHLNDPTDFKLYMEDAFSENRLRSELSNPDSEYYLARNADTDVGYFKLNYNSAQTDIQDPHACELERIYVAPSWQGRGIGEWMLKQAIHLTQNKQMTYIWLGVWEKNEAAIRFYEKLGFVKFGTHPYFIGTDKQTDWLMRLDLVPS